ncbi:MAG: alpha/beta hydrolase, partial [Pseudomonadota bacterium]
DACKAYLPHSLDGYLSEGSARRLVDARAARVRDLGARPVLVLTRQFKDEWYGTDPVARAAIEKREAHWRALHAEMASWSSRGEQRLVPDSPHGIPFTHPQAVVDGVNEIVEVVRRLSVAASQ